MVNSLYSVDEFFLLLFYFLTLLHCFVMANKVSIYQVISGYTLLDLHEKIHNLEGHTLLAVCDCLFDTFDPQSEDWNPCYMVF